MSKKIDHHKGLKDSTLRDLIAREMRDPFMRVGPENDEYRQLLVEKLEKAKRELEAYDLSTAFQRILSLVGWKLHDVSDYVGGGYNQNTYLDFVGTEQECAERYPGWAEERGLD